MLVASVGKWMLWARFYKKELIGSERCPIGKTYEDIIFSSNMYKTAKSILSLNKVCVGYRYRASSITAERKKIDAASMRWVLETSRDSFLLNKNEFTYRIYLNSYLLYHYFLKELSLTDQYLSSEISREIKKEKFFHALKFTKKIELSIPDTIFYFKKIFRFTKKNILKFVQI